MKITLYGNLRLGEIDPALPVSSTNYTSQAVRYFDPGCHSELNLNVAVEFYESTNGCSGVDVVDHRHEKSRTVTAQAVFDSGTHANLRAFLGGTTTIADAAPVAVASQSLNAASGAGVFAIGDKSYLGRMNITSLVVTANAVALTAGVAYELDPVFGRITWLVSVTGPVTASYSYQNPIRSAMMNAASKNYVAVLDGWNRDGGAPGQVVLYNNRPILSGAFALTTNEKSTMSVDLGTVADTNRAFGGQLGQFGLIQGFGLPDK